MARIAIAAAVVFLLVAAAAPGAHAATRATMTLSAYPGATRAAQLDAAYACMAAVKARLTEPQQPPPPPRRRASLPPPPPPPPPFSGPAPVAANVLRYAFHDCGTFDVTAPNAPANASNGGCTGAVRTTIAGMIAKGTYGTPAAEFKQHAGLAPAHNLLVGPAGAAGVCGDVRAKTPGCAAMPFADCISFAGLLAVAAKRATPPGGCPWTPGRVDAAGNNNAALLPSEFGMAAKQQQAFAKYGMALEKFGFGTIDRAITVLLGAHTIGRSRATPEGLCSKGLNALSATPDTFDTEYYKSILANANAANNTGTWFCADMGVVCNTPVYLPPRPGQPPAPPTLRRAHCGGKADSPFYPHAAELAAGGEAAFFSQFCSAYQAMSLIGFDVPATYDADAAKFAPLLAPLP